MRRGWLVVWSTLVGISWVVLAGVSAGCSSYVCLSFGDMLALLFIPAAIVWSLGLLVLYIVGRLRERRRSSGTGSTVGMQ